MGGDMYPVCFGVLTTTFCQGGNKVSRDFRDKDLGSRYYYYLNELQSGKYGAYSGKVNVMDCPVWKSGCILSMKCHFDKGRVEYYMGNKHAGTIHIPILKKTLTKYYVGLSMENLTSNCFEMVTM